MVRMTKVGSFMFLFYLSNSIVTKEQMRLVFEDNLTVSPLHRVQHRMISVDNFFVFLR